MIIILSSPVSSSRSDIPVSNQLSLDVMIQLMEAIETF